MLLIRTSPQTPGTAASGATLRRDATSLRGWTPPTGSAAPWIPRARGQSVLACSSTLDDDDDDDAAAAAAADDDDDDDADDDDDDDDADYDYDDDDGDGDDDDDDDRWMW